MNTKNSSLTFHSDMKLAPRYSEVEQQKSSGATYTPPEFALFVANQITQAVDLPQKGLIRVLDPACGDGELLFALLKSLPIAIRDRLEIVGYDTDSNAINSAYDRLSQDFPNINIRLEEKDFLDHIMSLQRSGDLFSELKDKPFNIVIANPPYVRTQIIGSKQAQEFAKSFGLTGRIDLYYPFLLGISYVLEENGIAGVITSNRFMTTKSGQSVRRAMLSQFQILHAWDLGDTKLFDAAVLPAVLLVKGKKSLHTSKNDGIAYTSIYETEDPAIDHVEDALSALKADNDTVVSIFDGRRFRVRHGVLDNGGNEEGIWRIATQATDQWLKTVELNTWNIFRRIGKIKVGVKSTADKVFIRNDWSELSCGRPELLRPLVTRKFARRFKPETPKKLKDIKEILYPHEMTEHGRSAVDLNLYPNSKQYLEDHREKLESREYLINGGRKWYELWVPHNPAAWSSPKLVFPDISDKPIFWIDNNGSVVNGECYWLKCDNKAEEDLLWLALAVANSSFIEEFYDHRFNNKLYAGRRRFITQYVELFPLPDPLCDKAIEIISLAKEIYEKTPSKDADILSVELDEKVWRVFGLVPKTSR